MQLPESYITSKFYQFAGSPKYNRFTKTYQASCPICREGKSWLKKRRLYYIPDHNSVFCHNCGWKSTPYKWIKHVTGLSFEEIKKDSLEYDTIDINKSTDVATIVDVPTLPGDCINLYNEAQNAFYKDNEIVQKALKYIQKRRLHTAINKPESLYLCFDKLQTHDKRIIIPFFDHNNKIIFYQSRGFIDGDNRPKYLSKCSERSLFNMNKIDSSNENIFVFEGPINAFFVKNSTAVGGIQDRSNILFSNLQTSQIDLLGKFYNLIWVLDSQWLDLASYNKTKKLIEMKQRVFIWPENVGKKFKDFNDICIALQMNEVSSKFILDNTFEGLAAQVALSSIAMPR